MKIPVCYRMTKSCRKIVSLTLTDEPLKNKRSDRQWHVLCLSTEKDGGNHHLDDKLQSSDRFMVNARPRYAEVAA